VEAPDESASIGLGRGFERETFETLANEMINAVFAGGSGGFYGRNVGPVAFVNRALRDPLLQQILLLGSEDFVRIGRRHQVLGIVREDALDQFALARLAGHDCFAFESGFAEVEAEFAFALAGIRPVAGETIVGKDGANRLIEADRGQLRCAGAANENESAKESEAGAHIGTECKEMRGDSKRGGKKGPAAWSR
jgi:hypothetical protein